MEVTCKTNSVWSVHSMVFKISVLVSNGVEIDQYAMGATGEAADVLWSICIFIFKISISPSGKKIQQPDVMLRIQVKILDS